MKDKDNFKMEIINFKMKSHGDERFLNYKINLLNKAQV